MNRISAIAFLAIASVASCTGAIAQNVQLKANIPFNFTVGDTWLPAGEYTVTMPMRHVLRLQNADHAATIVTNESHDESSSGSKLVFDRYENQYFLHEVLCPTVSSLNLDISASKTEKKARQRAIEAKLANDGQTMVAAR